MDTTNVRLRNQTQALLVPYNFSLPFAGVGIGLLVFSIIPTFYDVLRMSSWPSAQAELVFAELDMQRSSKSTTYLARARYSYQINGVYYTNDRVAISRRSDNIGSFQEDLGYRLEAAFAAKKPIEIWYNPRTHRMPLSIGRYGWGCYF